MVIEEEKKILICDCSQSVNPLSLAENKTDVVLKKFARHSDCKTVHLTDLPLFTQPHSLEINKKGFFMWHLKTMTDHGGLKVVPYDHQVWSDDMSEVIAISHGCNSGRRQHIRKGNECSGFKFAESTKRLDRRYSNFGKIQVYMKQSSVISFILLIMLSHIH